MVTVLQIRDFHLVDQKRWLIRGEAHRTFHIGAAWKHLKGSKLTFIGFNVMLNIQGNDKQNTTNSIFVNI